MRTTSIGWAPASAVAVALCFAAGHGLVRAEPAERLRDPFRPIGYRPPAPASLPEPDRESPDPLVDVALTPEPTEEQWEAARGRVRIQGFTQRGTRAMAMINDRVVGVGDRVEQSHAGILFHWRVETIDRRGAVTLRRWSENGGAVPSAGAEGGLKTHRPAAPPPLKPDTVGASPPGE